ncbi:RNase adapter RapZ [Profundibacterium mesophilum]|nr:RNase adapter RapZ [Profundibacterium mesophilum]
MPEPSAPRPAAGARLVLVTGPSGAGRSTAINALEDLGFEAIDNMPLSLTDRLLDGRPHDRPLALGIDARNRDFSTDAMVHTVDRLMAAPDINVELLYLDAQPGVLERRYSETRRRHPLAPDGMPAYGIAQEIDHLVPIRARANILIDTSDMNPHDLRAEIGQWFDMKGTEGLTLSVQSFSYKRGLPRGVDMVFDMRFLRNPHWEPSLRQRDGRDEEVARYIAEDPRFEAVFAQIETLTLTLLPAYRAEGKTHFAIAFGCTGGQHRSVAVAEKLSRALVQKGWRVSTRHRELERRATLNAGPDRGFAP